VTALEPKGEVFDPNLHEAVAQVPSEEAAPNTVIEVLEKGYCIHDRLLRPARVLVAVAAAGEAAKEET
jgi:molecular chaperone GrpE